MENAISNAYQLMLDLRKLQNNVNHEFDIDQHNLAQAIRYLGTFYQEMAFYVIDLKKKEAEELEKTKIAKLKSRKSMRDLAEEKAEIEEIGRYYLGS